MPIHFLLKIDFNQHRKGRKKSAAGFFGKKGGGGENRKIRLFDFLTFRWMKSLVHVHPFFKTPFSNVLLRRANARHVHAGGCPFRDSCQENRASTIFQGNVLFIENRPSFLLRKAISFKKVRLAGFFPLAIEKRFFLPLKKVTFY